MLITETAVLPFFANRVKTRAKVDIFPIVYSFHVEKPLFPMIPVRDVYKLLIRKML